MTPRALIGIVSVALLAACGEGARDSYQGYVEGEYVLVASPIGGTLETLAVARGQTVNAGAPLFTLERASETAALSQADANTRAAEARLANLRQGRRLPEQDAARAAVTNAQAALKLSSLQLAQQEKLAKAGFISETNLASARAARDRDAAQLRNAEAQLETARQSLGRDAELAAAQADADAARAGADQARTRYTQKAPAASAGAYVHDTFYTVGEWVPAASPVVSLLPPGNIKLRFFVPEPLIATVKAGQTVHATCDHCGAPMAAQISYISSQAEYTPPVIYGREARGKLVYLVEAVPKGDAIARLTPGQPVDVSLK